MSHSCQRCSVSVLLDHILVVSRRIISIIWIKLYINTNYSDIV